MSAKLLQSCCRKRSTGRTVRASFSGPTDGTARRHRIGEPCSHPNPQAGQPPEPASRTATRTRKPDSHPNPQAGQPLGPVSRPARGAANRAASGTGEPAQPIPARAVLSQTMQLHSVGRHLPPRSAVTLGDVSKGRRGKGPARKGPVRKPRSTAVRTRQHREGTRHREGTIGGRGHRSARTAVMSVSTATRNAHKRQARDPSGPSQLAACPAEPARSPSGRAEQGTQDPCSLAGSGVPVSSAQAVRSPSCSVRS